MTDFLVWLFNAPDDQNLPTWVRVFSGILLIVGAMLFLGISVFLIMLFFKLFPYPSTTIFLTLFLFFFVKLVLFFRNHAKIKATNRS